MKTMTVHHGGAMRLIFLWLLLGRVTSTSYETTSFSVGKTTWSSPSSDKRKAQRRRKKKVSATASPITSAQAELTRLWENRAQCEYPAIAPYLLVTSSCLLVGRTVTSEPVRRAVYFWCHAGPIVAHYRFTQWWFSRCETPIERRNEVYERLHNRYAEPSLNLMIHLKGLYVKVGQVLSSRPDMIPEQYIKVFSTAQDSIPPWPVKQVKAIINKSFRSEFGLKFHDVFESMDDVALGSASIGQVHRAVVREGIGHHGAKTVAVKVMHPGAEARVKHDFSVFRWLCRLVLPGWKGLLDELERQFLTEFDYLDEAASLRAVRWNMLQSPYKNRVVVPEPFEDLCSKTVLVMEMLEGKKLTDSMEESLAVAFGDKDKAADFLAARRKEVLFGNNSDESDKMLATADWHGKARLLRLHQKYKRFIDLLVDVHGYQIFVNGVYNSDCHPGNALDLGDGRLGLIDYGQTARIDEDDRLALANVVVEISKGSNNAAIAAAMRKMGFGTRKPDDDEMMANYALLFFDNDSESKRSGFATPQQYFASLMFQNRLESIPDSAVFVARTSFLFRGLNSAIGEKPMRTAHRWSKHATEAIDYASS